MILTVTPNPCVDKTLKMDSLRLGKKNRQVEAGCVAGGKGNNAARCVRTLGCPASAMLIVGGHTGRQVVEMLEKEDDVACIPYWTPHPTRTITTILEKHPPRQTALFEPGPILSEQEVEEFLTLFESALATVRMVTLNGTVPCESLTDAYAKMISMARARDIPVMLDSYGEEFARGIEAIPWCVKINRDEASEWLGAGLDSEDAVWHALKEMQFRLVSVAIITHGAERVYCAWGEERFIITPPKVKEVNPVGSGDVFAGALCVAALRGESPSDALAFATAAGAANAQCWEIGHFDLEQLESLRKQVVINAL